MIGRGSRDRETLAISLLVPISGIRNLCQTPTVSGNVSRCPRGRTKHQEPIPNMANCLLTSKDELVLGYVLKVHSSELHTKRTSMTSSENLYYRLFVFDWLYLLFSRIQF